MQHIKVTCLDFIYVYQTTVLRSGIPEVDEKVEGRVGDRQERVHPGHDAAWSCVLQKKELLVTSEWKKFLKCDKLNKDKVV